MFMHRRSLLAAPLILAATQARAADWVPKQPIRILVGYAPGGTADIAARIAADTLAKKHGLDPWAMVAHAVQDFPSPTRVSTSPAPETTYDPAPRRPSAPPARPSHSGAIKKVTRAGLGGASTAAGNRCPGWRSSAVRG